MNAENKMKLTRKVAVLIPEEIRYRRHTAADGVGTLVQTLNIDGATYYVYSSGKLEWVISQGFDVYVITAQPELRKVDKWWIKIMPEKDNVILGMSKTEAFKHPEEVALYHWLVLFGKLGIPAHGVNHSGDARELLEKHGVLFGNQIHLPHPRSNE
jgi:hypothetical protein